MTLSLSACSKDEDNDNTPYVESMTIDVPKGESLFSVLIEKNIIGKNEIIEEKYSYRPYYETITRIGHCTITGSLNDEDWILFSKYSFCSNFDLKNVKTERVTENAFDHNEVITSVILPDNITSIEDYTFDQCENLEWVDIPSNIVSIGNRAFNRCEKLKSIDIPDGVVLIEGSAFSGCKNLESIDIPNGVVSIGGGAFENCEKLKFINIPSSVVSIGGYAFDGCLNLESITIPNSVKAIGVLMLGQCAALKEIHSQMLVLPAFKDKHSKYFICGTEDADVKDTSVYTTLYSDCILYVPKGTLQNYQEDELWGRFNTIIEE